MLNFNRRGPSPLKKFNQIFPNKSKRKLPRWESQLIRVLMVWLEEGISNRMLMIYLQTLMSPCSPASLKTSIVVSIVWAQSRRIQLRLLTLYWRTILKALGKKKLLTILVPQLFAVIEGRDIRGRFYLQRKTLISNRCTNLLWQTILLKK